jgi:hypothetical protein
MQKLLKIIVSEIIVAATTNLMFGLIEQSINAQNMTNANNLTGIKNDSSSASVTARLNISSPETEPEDYPTPKPDL